MGLKMANHIVNGKDVVMSDEDAANLAAEQLANTLISARENKQQEIKAEMMKRIFANVPALSSVEMLDLMVELWPMLNTGLAGVGISSAKNIYVYGKERINQAKIATQEQLDAYDPVTDIEWPA